MDLLPIPQPTDFEKFLATCDDPINAWDTKLARKELTNASIDWILSLAEWTKLIRPFVFLICLRN